jgi:tRNA-2-methylthio-N6-dimethylallyladenosine synthase
MPTSTTGKTFHLWTIGCQMNAADSRRLAAELEILGYTPTAEPEDADLVVLNTCVVRQQSENKVYGRLGSLKSIKAQRPDMTIGLMGCMVGTKEAPSLQKKFPFVDVFMPPSDTGPLMDYIEDNGLLSDMLAAEAHERAIRDRVQDADQLLPVEQRGNTVTAYVPIVLGCSHACTFCIIPYRRGKERSRPTADIVREVRALVDQGIKEVMLLGQIVDRYGLELDSPTTLAALLREIHRIDGLERIRFLTSHPNWMTDELLDTVAELERVCPHLEVPIQAGNDEVLANMRRGYTADEYYQLIHRIRDRMPDATINTDIIVGFPGETYEQFLDTLMVVKDIQFDKIHLARYSARPRTVATRRMVDDVSEEEKRRRFKMIESAQKEIQRQKNEKMQGATVDVLVEGSQKGRWRGRTPHNRLVIFDDNRQLLGQTIPVKVDWTGPFTLVGQAADREPVSSNQVPISSRNLQ